MGEGEHTVWDDHNNEANIGARQIDFADLDEVFDGRFSLVVEDRRRDYGERRFNMLVQSHGFTFNITFTRRPPKHRVISARLASRNERRVYDAARKDT